MTQMNKAVFYLRDSGGRHEMTPSEYVLWGQRKAHEQGLSFSGTPEQLENMIRDGQAVSDSIYLDFGVCGNTLSRVGLDAMLKEAISNPTITHVMIPRRDRLARPNDPLDGLKLENLLRSQGVSLIFMNRVCNAFPKGKRHDVTDTILALLDYDRSGQDRRDLAEKSIFAHISLAKSGFSTGGRPPYGFRRWLVKEDGTTVRELDEGERVRMAGHHVVWLPTAEDEIIVIRRILCMLETMPATQVAATLTAENVPSPDAGRLRTDNGVQHRVSGVWHQSVVVGIARNPLLIALVTYGTRSMGDQLRFTPTGPRELTDADFLSGDQPKVIRNSPADRIVVPGRFEPLVESDQHQKLIDILDKRAGTQRGKPRSQDPTRNPLGGRVFDINCTWPMYRVPYLKSFRYTCGLYQQSHAAQCAHNHVDGPTSTRFLLSCIRQKLLSPTLLPKLRQKLEMLAKREQPSEEGEKRQTTENALAKVRQDIERVSRNLALASNPEQYQAIAAVFDELKKSESRLNAELALQQDTIRAKPRDSGEVEGAMKLVERLVDLADHTDNMTVAQQLFELTNARVYFSFQPTRVKNRTLNKLAGGIVTFGKSEPPISVYNGPTDRKNVQNLRIESSTEKVEEPSETNVPDGDGDSSGNDSRGDKTPIELFITGVRGWEAGLRRRLDGDKPN